MRDATPPPPADGFIAGSLSPDDLAAEGLPPDLAFRPAAALGRAWRFVPRTGSTMADAAAWARAGAPHGALVLADHQTAGRGRHGRAWHDAPGHALLMTLVLRPSSIAPERFGLVPIAAGVALAEAAEAMLRTANPPPAPPPNVRLKWPNDVLLGGRKLAGVLAEATWTGTAGAPLVLLGAGVNVGRAAVPPALAAQATALVAHVGSEDATVTRGALLSAFLPAFEARLDALAGAEGAAALCAAATRRLAGRGAAVRVAFPQAGRAPLAGTLEGLAPDGALVLGTPQGPVPVYAGEVTLSACPAHPFLPTDPS